LSRRSARLVRAVLPVAWILVLAGATCGRAVCADSPAVAASPSAATAAAPGPKTIHVVVALCDNRFQGIVPVPARLGDGDDPAGNLYWGAAYGVKTYFRRLGDWRLLASQRGPKPEILERVIFRHRSGQAILVADAYRGREIRAAVADFLCFAAGRRVEPIQWPAGVEANSTLPSGGGGAATPGPTSREARRSGNDGELGLSAGGGADLLVYVGHDGLMDFSLAHYPSHADERRRQAIVLACLSRSFFAEPLRRAGAEPLLWTTGLLAPEAYVLSAALAGWLAGENGAQIRRRAAEAYDRYQKCGLKAALRLFATGP